MSLPRLTSGETAKATVADAEIELLAAVPGTMTHLVIINDGGAPGFFRIGATGTMSRLKGNAVTILDDIKWSNEPVNVKRVPAGSNLTNLFAFAW